MKSFPVIFSPIAIDDIEQTVAFYEEQHTGLSKRFVTSLQLTPNKIKRNPFFSSIRYDDIRCAAINKFPYLIHYYIDEDKLVVTIIAVYSTYKEPHW